MKSKHLKRIITIIAAISLLLPFCLPTSVSAKIIQPTKLNGINIERKLNFLIAYTDEYDSKSTGTDNKGIEAVVNSKGIVTKIEGNNNEIPNDGFVLSGSSLKKDFIKNSIKEGYQLYLDKDTNTITIIPKGYSPFNSSTIEYNAINSDRSNDTLIIFDGSDGKITTGTNQWGYEIVVDKDGFIISLDGNNNVIPNDGLVLSSHGIKKKALTEVAKLGMSVDINNTTKIVTISYSKKNAIETPRLIYENWKLSYNEAKSLYKNLNYNAIQTAITNLESEIEIIKTAIDKGDMLTFTVSQNRFDSISNNLKFLITEAPVVEGRALWIRPKQTNVEDVQKVVKQIYELGFNIICVETLFDNTLTIPVPEGSIFSHNPIFHGFDVLKAYVEECHKYGIELHVWMPVYRVAHEGSKNPTLGLNVKKPEWLNISNTNINYVDNEYGKGYFLNPALPEVHDYLISVYTYILENYSIDGFQLDYIRYPDMLKDIDYGYDDYTRGLFKEQYDVDPINLTTSNSLWKNWIDFRAKFVTDLVLDVKALVAEKRPDIYLACDVAPSFDESLERMKQDTTKWIKDAYIDIVYPMAYGTVDRVKTWSDTTIKLAGDDVYTYIGVGNFGVETFFDQIVTIRENDSDGIAFFAYEQYVEGNYEIIADTLFSHNAVSPTFNSKKSVVAQLKYTKYRIKNIITPTKISGSIELDAICVNIDTLITKLESSKISDCKNDIDKLITDINSVLNSKVKDENAKKAVKNDLRIISKTTMLSKDDAKTAYYESHPLPDMYEISEDGGNESIDNTNSDNTITSIELSFGEKLLRGFAIAIIAVSAFGFPFYFILDRRRKKLLKEFEEKNNKDKEQSDKKDEDSTD